MLQNSLCDRHEAGKFKYKKFQGKLKKIDEIAELLKVIPFFESNRIKGKKEEEVYPKIGEFVVVSTDRKYNPEEIDIPLDELLEVSQFLTSY